MKQTKAHYQKGYTLIELSISITIVALMISGGLTVYTKKQTSDRYRTTWEKIDQIEQAIEAFVLVEGYIPCPALGEEVETSATFGVSAYTSPNCDNLTGMLPVRTLNVPDDLAYDGWQHKFTYVVATGMGNTEDFADDINNLGDISVTDLVGNERTQLNQTSAKGAAYVLVSHGPNALGAWLKNVAGTFTAPVAGSFEEENIDGDFSLVQDERTDAFDDITLFVAKDNFGRPRVQYSPVEISQDDCDNAVLLDDAGISAEWGDFVALNPGVYTDDRDDMLMAAENVRVLCENPPLE